MRNRVIPLIFALALVFSGCQKDYDEPSGEHGIPNYNEADYLMDGLFKKLDGEYRPILGSLSEAGLVIPATSVFEAERHFRALLPSYATPKETGNAIVWSMTDDQGNPQGDAVFELVDEKPYMARITLPDSFPADVRPVLYQSSVGLLGYVNPDVLEDLEDNYYYGAIVNISDHGYGSGKFVVFREYNVANGSPGMAVRLDSHHWDTWELNLKDNAARVFGRASCLSTLETAGDIYRKDRTILAKQLKNAGCTIIDQHYASSTKTWNGWNYYYCLHDGESDWIGPINDTDFYECWIYWFKPEGNGIKFW